jgi:hypothetical protein
LRETRRTNRAGSIVAHRRLAHNTRQFDGDFDPPPLNLRASPRCLGTRISGHSEIGDSAQRRPVMVAAAGCASASTSASPIPTRPLVSPAAVQWSMNERSGSTMLAVSGQGPNG